MAKMMSVSLQTSKGGLKLEQVLVRWIYSPLIWGILGVLLGRSEIFGEVWPFGLAFAAAWRAWRSEGRRCLVPAVGVAVGITLRIGLFMSLPYYAALLVICFAPGEGVKVRRNWLIFSSLALKAALHYWLHPVPMVFIVAITECTFAVFTYGLLTPALRRCLDKELAHGEIYAFLIALTLLVSTHWQWGGFSPRLFIACTLLVLGARVGGLGVTSLLGPSLALLVLLLGEPTQMVLLIVTASLLTGFLHKFAWGSYVGVSLALVFSVPGPAEAVTLQWLLTVLVAAWAAGRVPQQRLDLVARLIPGTEPYLQQDKGHDEHLRKVLDQKIDSYLTVFEELETTLRDNENPLFHRQMHDMAELLKAMKNSFTPEAHFTRELEEILLRQFSGEDLSHITALQSFDGYEIYGARQESCGGRGFCQRVAEFCSGTLTSQRYAVINNCSTGKACGFQIGPCPSYKVEIGKAKVASQGVSGDSGGSFEISNGKVAIVLSDGMGVGEKAQAESSMALRLLERMVKAGYDLRTAVSFINRLLMLRNQDDMFVTIDLVVVDLFTGQLEFVKVGAAPSYIKRGREVEIIHNHTLPVGMIPEVEVESDRRTLKEGELLIMTTDGVLNAQRSVARKEEWMCWNLRRLEDSNDMASLAEEVLQESIAVADGRVDDDMMVVVARLVPVNWGIETYRRESSVL